MFKGLGKIFYHMVIIVLSAAAALSLPHTGRFIAQNYQTYWSLIENDKVFLVSVEMAVAVLLITFFNYLGSSWRDRRLSNMATKAGLVFLTKPNNFFSRRKIKKFAGKKIKKLKEKEGFSKDIMLIGSTGFSTFVDPSGDLHKVIKSCREAKIMLLNPFGEGAYIRAKSISDPSVTPESFKNQIMNSIGFLKCLKEAQKNISLKLYQEAPLLKLAILGDYISMKFYHAGLSVNEMPEYIFKHSHDNSSLYGTFYQLFLSKWRDSNIPEYDFDTGDLIYRDGSGNEIRREEFNEMLEMPLLNNFL